MSQHKLLTNTRKKITYLAVALSLASAQIAAYGAASAISAAPTDDSRAHQDAASMSGSGSANNGDTSYMPAGQKHGYGGSSESGNSDNGYNDGQNYTQATPKHYGSMSGTSSNAYDGQGSMGHDSGNTQGDWQHKQDGGGGQPPQSGNEKPQPQPQPVTNNNNNENNTNVTVKPADVHQVVNQETNVTVQQEQSQQQVVRQVVQPTHVIERRTVVAAATTTRPTTMPTAQTQTQTQAQTQTPVVSGGKGALEETGFSAKPATLAGLGILGALGALSVVTRRNKDFARG